MHIKLTIVYMMLTYSYNNTQILNLPPSTHKTAIYIRTQSFKTHICNKGMGTHMRLTCWLLYHRQMLISSLYIEEVEVATIAYR